MSGAPPSYQESVGGGYTNYGTQQYDPTKGPRGQSFPPIQGGYQGPQPSYQQQQTIMVQPQQQVIIVGGCPACRVGVLEDDFTCLGVCCAILFFPIGILCCLAMKQQRCTNCGAIFG